MLGRFYFSEDGGNSATGMNDEGGAFSSHVFLSVHALLHPEAVGGGDLLFRIREERKGKEISGDKFFVAGGGIDADAEDFDPVLEVGPRVAQATGLGGTTRGVVLRIKIKHHCRPAKIL